MVRDEEIKRLISYAKGLHLKVQIKRANPRNLNDAELVVDEDGKAVLTVFKHSKTSKIEIVLSLIHEIGHHLAFIDSNRQFEAFTETTEVSTDQERKLAWEVEANDTKYWDRIYKDTACKFPLWMLDLHKEFDVWQYEFRYLTTRFPYRKEKREKTKELLLKYKPKKDQKNQEFTEKTKVF